MSAMGALFLSIFCDGLSSDFNLMTPAYIHPQRSGVTAKPAVPKQSEEHHSLHIQEGRPRNIIRGWDLKHHCHSALVCVGPPIDGPSIDGPVRCGQKAVYEVLAFGQRVV